MLMKVIKKSRSMQGVLLGFILLLAACSDPQALVAHDVALPGKGSEGAVLYEKFCSACHAPPRISSHNADEWPNIVARMQTHRIKKAYTALSDSELQTLLAYLQKYSESSVN